MISKLRNVTLFIVATVILLSVLRVFYVQFKRTTGYNEIRVPSSAKEIKGKNYQDVMTQLQTAGFTNIETDVMADLVTGWLTKDGEIERVSVNGNADFSSGSKFPVEAKIVITYHTFAQKVEDEIKEKIKEIVDSCIGKPAFEVIEALKETEFTIHCRNEGRELSNFDPNAFYLEDWGLYYDAKEITLILLPVDMYGYKGYEERLSAIGDIIEFGLYEQDNVVSNGKEAIKWVVLDTDGNRRLLCSLYILDNQAYNDTTQAKGTTWEYSSLRYWLNNSFINEAFSQKQKSAITLTSVENDSTTTQDKIFLLSYDDAWDYFSDDSLRQAAATTYAKAQTRYSVSDKTGMSPWWLRTPVNSLYKFVVNPSGLHENSPRVNEDEGIRPALWIDINLLNTGPNSL
jgi:hypothetical protein